MSTRIDPQSPDAAAIIERYSDDPVGFNSEVLQREAWSGAEAIMADMAQPNARVAVRSCHASSKTHTSAGIVLWWTCTGGYTLSTAPTDTQVKELLWGEIHAAYAGAKYPLGGSLLQKELVYSPSIKALGLATDQSVRFQGFHGSILIVLDEAPGVRPDIWEGIDAIAAAGDVRVLAIGNPTVASGPFFDIFTRHRALWKIHHIDAFRTPNLRGVRDTKDLLGLSPAELAYAPRPYLITRRYCYDMLLKYGEDSPFWESRVRGNFPRQGIDSLLSLQWIEYAAEATPFVLSDDLVAGLDVAGDGEAETVLAIRKGAQLISLDWWADPEPRGAVVAKLLPYKNTITVNVDVIAMGYYFAHHLRDQGFKVRFVNVGEPPDQNKLLKKLPEKVLLSGRKEMKFLNKRAHYYWHLRTLLQWPFLPLGHNEERHERLIGGITDELTISQLAGLRFREKPNGATYIEPKEEAAKRGVPSPDRAEAIMLCYAPIKARSAGSYVAGGTAPFTNYTPR